MMMMMGAESQAGTQAGRGLGTYLAGGGGWTDVLVVGDFRFLWVSCCLCFVLVPSISIQSVWLFQLRGQKAVQTGVTDCLWCVPTRMRVGRGRKAGLAGRQKEIWRWPSLLLLSCLDEMDE